MINANTKKILNLKTFINDNLKNASKNNSKKWCNFFHIKSYKKFFENVCMKYTSTLPRLVFDLGCEIWLSFIIS